MSNCRLGRLLVLLTSLALLLAACGGGDGEETADADAGSEQPAASSEPATAQESEIERGEVVVGSTNFTEQEIVAELYAQVLEDAGYTVDRRYQLGSREVVFPALQQGELDVTPEYIGTLLEFISGGSGAATSDVQETLSALREQLPDGLAVLEPAEAQDKNALAVTQETAQEYDLETVSDLQGVANELVLGGPPECPQRPLCLPGYQDVYDLEFAEFRPLDAGGPLTTEGLNSGEIDVGLVFSTQSAIRTNDWVVLEDDQGLQPAENITPAVREEVLNGEVGDLLNSVSATLTTDKVIDLNTAVDAEGQAVEDAATEYLEQEGVLGAGGGEASESAS